MWKVLFLSRNTVAVKMRGRGHRSLKLWFPLPFASSVTFGKLLFNLSTPQLSYLWNGDDNNTYLIECFEELLHRKAQGVALWLYLLLLLYYLSKTLTEHVWICWKVWKYRTQFVPLKMPWLNGDDQEKTKRGWFYTQKHMYPGCHGSVQRVLGKVQDGRWYLS